MAIGKLLGKHVCLPEAELQTRSSHRTVRTLETTVRKFELAPMGALAPGSVHARPSAQAPIDTSRNFPAQKSFPKFRNPRTTFENTPLFCS